MNNAARDGDGSTIPGEKAQLEATSSGKRPKRAKGTSDGQPQQKKTRQKKDTPHVEPKETPPAAPSTSSKEPAKQPAPTPEAEGGTNVGGTNGEDAKPENASKGKRGPTSVEDIQNAWKLKESCRFLLFNMCNNSC